MDKDHSDRGIIWWVSALLAPLGVLGGPIAIAEMMAGVIKWHGSIG